MSSSYLLLSFISLIASAVGATCQPRAISVPYKNVRLATAAEARGVMWQIGKPAQSIALAPSAYYNETYLWGGPGIDKSGGWCPGSYSASTCATYRGGLYDRSLSTTDVDAEKLTPNVFDGTVANWTKDDITLADNTTLPQYKFAINTGSSNEFVHKGELGLGRESVFLKTLSEQQNVSSKSYSFFWGNEVTKEPRDGSLTLGGYDQALIDGKNVTAKPQKFVDSCREGLIVNLTSLDLQINGATKDAWEGMADLSVCIIASTNNIMSIPEAYWAPIETLMGVKRTSTRNGTSSEHFWNTTLIEPASATYSGNMAVTINNELTVTIPNDQLIFDERYISRNGIVESRNTAKQIPIVRIPAGNGMMPRLGGMFFSSAVLVVNHDKSLFHIAQAATKSATPKIMAFDTSNDCVGEVKAAAATGTPGANSGGNNPSTGSGQNGSNGNGNSTEGGSSGLSGGAIGGIVVGVVGGIALIAGIAFILWRRRQQHSPLNATEMDGYGPPVEKYRHDVAEVHGDGGHELGVYSDNRHVTYELDGAGRPSEVSGLATGSANSRDGLTR